MARFLIDSVHCEMLPQMYAAGWGGRTASEALILAHRAMETMERVAPGLLHPQLGRESRCCLYHPSKISQTPGVDCMPGSKQYLRIKLLGGDSPNIQREYGHRLMCWAYHGPPQGNETVVRHTCCNPKGRCLNPAHLEWSTVAVNCGDVARLRRQREGARKQLQNMSDYEGGRSPSQQSQ